MGKAKRKPKQSEEFYEELVKARTDDAGWSTGPASANDMAVDETAAEKEAAPSTSVEPSGKVGGSSMMQLDQPAGKKRKLGVAAPTLKRGQRTKAQRLRKVSKLEKAMARVEKVGVKVAGESKRKVRKLALKHMY